MSDQDTPIINFAGERVALGPPRRDLLETYLRWRNDFTVMRQLGDVEPITMEQEIARYEALASSPSTARFTIYDRDSLTPIGSTALDDIDFRHGTAEFSILIGEPEYRNRGYGTETARLMLDYAFVALGLHSVFLRVFSSNPAAQRAYEKAGFRQFAVRHESQRMDEQWWDTIYMECLTTEFESPVLGKVFVPDEVTGDG